MVLWISIIYKFVTFYMSYTAFLYHLAELVFNFIGILFFIEFLLSFWTMSTSNILKNFLTKLYNKVLLIYNKVLQNKWRELLIIEWFILIISTFTWIYLLLLIIDWFDRELGLLAIGILWGFYFNYLIQGKFWKQRNIFYIYLLSLPLILIPAWWPMNFNYNLVPYFYYKTTFSFISGWYELFFWPAMFAAFHLIFWPLLIVLGLFIIFIYCLLWYLFAKNIFILYKSWNSKINTNVPEQDNN